MERMLARTLVIIYVACCVMLSACGGGSDGTEGTTDAVADAVVDGGVGIVADSRVDAALDGKEPEKDTVATDTKGDKDVVENDVEPVELPPDTTPPTVKIVAPKDGAFVTGIETVVVEASDDREMDQVELYVDGELLTTLTTEPYEHDWDAAQMVPGNYLLSALAYDEAGNSNDDSVVVFVQGECDENGDCPPKSVKVVTPVDGATVCGEVTIEAAATDDVGIAEMEFFVDGDSLGVDVESPFQKDWDTADNEKGEHVIKVLARDTAGYEAFATVLVNVDNSGGACDNLPNVSIDFPEDGAYLDGVVEIVAKASDDIGVLKVQFFIDNALVSEDNTVPYKVEWDTAEFDEGAHTIKAIAYDTSEQMGKLQIQVTVDRTPPQLALLSPAPGIPYHDLVTFEAEATDNFKVNRVEFSIDGDDPVVVSQAPYSMDLDTAEWASGTYDFEAVAFDGADHSDSMTGEFLLDRPPLLSIGEPGDGAEVYGTVNVKAQVDDDLGLEEVGLYIDGEWKAAMQSQGAGAYKYAWKTPYQKADHEVKVVATDLAGQEAEGQVTVSVDYPVTVELLLCDKWDWCDPVEPDSEVTGTVHFEAEAKDDGSAIASVEFHVDGDLEYVDDEEPFEFEWDSSAVTDGAHTIKAIAANELAETAQDFAEVIVNNCDLDGDGYLALTCAGTDCDDGSAEFNPGELDTVGNDIDENCDDVDGMDNDGDGYASEESGGDDCDDGSGLAFPGAEDTVGDQADQNCDGLDGVDGDEDGYASIVSGGTDCDDLNPDKNPGKPDTVGNGIDDNCDGIDGTDGDGDGYASLASGGDDCDDAKVNVHPCADDIAGDGLDANCDGKDLTSCDDCNACTVDTFDGAVCQHAPIGDGQACDDGDACTTGEKCTGGVCGAGAALNCSDGNVCTLDACDPLAGCTHGPDPAKAGQPCPGGVCFAGVCCAPACGGKECGDDGCGGSCGACGQDEECDAMGQCVDPGALVFVSIPGGTFTMGCSPGDTDCYSNEKPPHSVTLSPFEMLETEVTEAQYLTVTGDDPSCDYGAGGGPDSPVECVDWYEAKDFCEAVGGRLCTEAEWEYAARGGTTTKYYCGNSSGCLNGIAWWEYNSGTHKHDVKGKTPNAYGLYDMLGNVWEWTADWYDKNYYSSSPPTNPKGPNSGSYRVFRGGSFGSNVYVLRVSARSGGTPSAGYHYLGLRCCRSE